MTTPTATLAARLRGALTTARLRADEGIAMVMAMMLILIIATLSIAIAGVTLAQIRPTELVQKNVQTVHGAEAGVDAALGVMRSAVIQSVGVTSLLPCNTSTVNGKSVALSGGDSEGAADTSYAVSIRYYTSDPTSQNAAWRDANALACSGTGPSAVPSYALIQSSGSISTGHFSTSGNRTLETVYAFKRLANNIAGGNIAIYGNTSYCMVAASASAGSQIKLQLCATSTNKALTQWVYLGNDSISASDASQKYPLELALVSTLSTGTPLCITAANATATTATLQACGQDPATKLLQQWSYNDNGQFEGPANSGKTNGWCLTPSASPVVPGALLNQAKCGSASSWQPDPTVGSGQAGSTTGLPDVANGQLVNFKEFGRCFDITSANINTTYIIDYPCKQAPDPTQVKWNQRESWNYNTSTGVGTRTIQPTGAGAPNNYCLTPSTSGPSSSELYAVFRTCTGAANQQWTFTGNTGDYQTSYMVKDLGTGQCLGLGSPNAALTAWSTITVERCNGADMEQKWNAPPTLAVPGRVNTRETGG